MLLCTTALPKVRDSEWTMGKDSASLCLGTLSLVMQYSYSMFSSELSMEGSTGLSYGGSKWTPEQEPEGLVPRVSSDTGRLPTHPP